MPATDLTKKVARRFSVAYIASLGLLAALVIVGGLFEQWSLDRAQGDAHEVNMAGRQRMLSERLTKLMLASVLFPDAKHHANLVLLRKTLDNWEHYHHGLWHGDLGIHLTGARNEPVAEMFVTIEPAFRQLADAVNIFLVAGRIAESPMVATLRKEALLTALASQRQYVEKMDRVVATLERDSAQRVRGASLIGYAVLGSMMLLLVLLGVFVLRPTGKKLNEVLGEVEQERSGLASFVLESPTPIIQLYPDGRLMTLNHGAEELLARMPGPYDDPGLKVGQLFENCFGQGSQAEPCKETEISVGGRHYLFQFIHAQGGRQVFALGIEITARKLAEEAMARARDAAEASDQLKSHILATMSHELRTPLNAIIGFSEALSTGTYGEVAPRQARKLENILAAGRRLLNLVDAVLDVSQIEAGRVSLQLDLIPVGAWLGNILASVSSEAEAHKVRLNKAVSSEAASLKLNADQAKLAKVLTNLLTNAVKFTPEGGQVTLAAHLEPEADELQISVEDSGIGFSPQDAQKLFTPFFQAESGLNRQFEGGGLGLALCRKLVELHGGRIWAHSPGKDKGSTFTFSLPLSQDEPASPEDDQGAEPA
ncbi:MAG: type IV pili methyl-accepting chemotaxis transducer N-terminal domain-containing protein [Desulfarculaceae bacterium]|nr:type IV pili methyl-accepting chemotaxis transducer N-terminal domain-containing protein [Desulfarculaceae bacterium]MCF8071152.1 type IV pili methyl-accepting chemotaxis transducer N-terminal domain-containing protein [Desulfarculaceae bacterium]MCF8101245.1 type IV pili methyl-accepting chemotaxis transducer N-terminal domain-containing protein [Desulfarculaceae bacterium]MCF8115206.1 type IV pili methyl-accepting chemotaxis transducer N-terminal domain-containing protein [Desulfarculaceae 